MHCALRAENPEICECPSVSPYSPGFSLLSWPSRRIASFAPWMKFAINALQPLQRHVRINLAGGNIGLAQDRLRCTPVRAVAHHVRGAAWLQHGLPCMTY